MLLRQGFGCAGCRWSGALLQHQHGVDPRTVARRRPAALHPGGGLDAMSRIVATRHASRAALQAPLRRGAHHRRANQAGSRLRRPLRPHAAQCSTRSSSTPHGRPARNVRFGVAIDTVRRDRRGGVAGLAPGVAEKQNDQYPGGRAPRGASRAGSPRRSRGSSAQRWKRVAASAAAIVCKALRTASSARLHAVLPSRRGRRVLPTNAGPDLRLRSHRGPPASMARAGRWGGVRLRSAPGRGRPRGSGSGPARRQGSGAGRDLSAPPGLGFLRRAYGPGWALVGDAGCFKDPITSAWPHGRPPRRRAAGQSYHKHGHRRGP